MMPKVFRIYNGEKAYLGATRIVLAKDTFEAEEKAIAHGELPWCKAAEVDFSPEGVERSPWLTQEET